MSLDIVSKCLELDAEEPIPRGKSSKKKSGINSKDAMAMITTNRQGVWGELRKLQKKHKKDVLEKRKKKKFKSAIELYKEANDVDHTEANVEALLRISQLGKVDDEVSRKILYHQPNRLARDVEEKVEEEETSVFTDEDFKKFAKEYHVKLS